MGYKTELQNNNTALRSILETVQELPEVSGDPTKVCRVRVQNVYGHSNLINTFCFTTLSDGEISFVVRDVYQGDDFTVENVVCGSPISYSNDGYTYTANYPRESGGVEEVGNDYYGACLIAPTEAGAEGVIELWPDN